MPVTNSESVMVQTRVKNTGSKPHYDHLKRKAIANPANQHNNISTEVNILIEADYDRSQRRKKRK